MRNPWGTQEKEWNGDYCEGSSKWNSIGDDIKQELKVGTGEMDGNFYMPFNLFLKHFFRVHFVHVNLSGLSIHDEDDDHKNYHWISKSFEGEWKKGVNSGGEIT